MKRVFLRSLQPLLALLRCTRGTSAVAYLMVTGLVGIVAVSAFGAFERQTSTAVQNRSTLVAKLDGTEAEHADSLPAEIAGATANNLVNAAEDGQLVVNALPYVAGLLAPHGRRHGDDDPNVHDPAGLEDPVHPEDPTSVEHPPTTDPLGPRPDDPTSPKDPRTDLPCVGDSCAVGSGNCFVAGTEVATPLGPRAIETLVVGDVVWSRADAAATAAAPGSDERAARRVVRTFVTHDRDVIDMWLAAEDGTRETLRATPQHPFHVAGIGWRDAADLASGDRIDTDDGRTLEVVAEATHATRETVYNFEVEGLHTYFVGQHRAWVHNDCDEEGTTPQEPGKDVVPWRPENPNAKPWKPKSLYWRQDIAGDVKLPGTNESGDRVSSPASSWYEGQVRDFYGGMDRPPGVKLDAPIHFTGERGPQWEIRPDVQTPDGSMVGDAKMRDPKAGWYVPNAVGSLEKLYIWANHRGNPGTELALINSREVSTAVQNRIKAGLADWLASRGLSNEQIIAVLHRVAFRHVPAGPPRGY